MHTTVQKEGHHRGTWSSLARPSKEASPPPSILILLSFSSSQRPEVEFEFQGVNSCHLEQVALSEFLPKVRPVLARHNPPATDQHERWTEIT